MRRKIIFYRTEDGKCPVEDFLDSLQPKEAQKVLWVLRLIEELDKVPSQYFKKLTDTEEIWECRITIKSNAYRVFSFFLEGDTVVLTKKLGTQKTAISRIENHAQDIKLSTIQKVARALGKNLEVRIT